MLADRTINLRGTEKVKQAIYQWIKKNKPRQNDKFFSQRELAKMLNVDPMTAHKALVELTNDGVIYRKQGKGSFFGSDPDINKGLNLALVSPGSHFEIPENNPNCWHMVQLRVSSIFKSLKRNDSFSTIIVDPGTSSKTDIDRLRKFDAIFFSGHEEFNTLIANLIKNGIRVVVDDYTDDCNFDCIKVRHPIRQDAKTGVRYLIERGYKNIAYIGSSISDENEKFAGYHEAMDDYGMKTNENLLIGNIEHQNEGGRGAALLLNRNVQFDAVFIDTDIKAVGAIEYFTKSGLTIPDDIGIMGFDGLKQYTEAPLYLTSVRPAYYESIRGAVDFIRNDNTRQTVYDVPSTPGKVISNRTTK